MLFSKILVAYDDSGPAQRSLEKALEIAEMKPDTEIQVVHVIRLPELAGYESDQFQELVGTIYQKGRDILKKVDSQLSILPNRSQTFLLEGKTPAYIILNHAKENNCDLIIIGSRGLGGIKEFLGSVSHTVVQRSKIPVLIIK